MAFERKAIYTRENEASLIDLGLPWNFEDFSSSSSLHDLHPYPARFIPPIPRRAIELWSKEGDLIYDPFCGCGTTLLEASLLGRRSIGTDNNDVAVLVSRAKTTIYNSDDISKLKSFRASFLKNLEETTFQSEDLPSDVNFPGWFQPEVLEQLGKIRQVIEGSMEPVRTFLLAVYSSIIVRVSLQDSDTRYARIVKEISKDNVTKSFLQRLDSMTNALVEMPANHQIESNVIRTDARLVPQIENNSVNLIVTSPPYLNAYDYHKYHRQRLHLIRGDIEFARKKEIGSHDEFTKKDATPNKYFQDMTSCLEEWKRVLVSKGRCLVLVGDAIVNKAPVNVADTLVDIGLEIGFQLEERWIRSVKGTRRSFNVKNSRMSHEHGLVFVKK